jgi:nucleoside-diphosphate-sugar epimerase
VIDENTPCCPIDDYGRQKLMIEHTLRDTPAGNTEIAILRPAAVFGVGGQALLTLRDSLAKGPRLVSYGRSSLFGRRRMHLVPVETVVAALWFLCTVAGPLDREVFIVAEDDDPFNNFRDVEKILMAALHQPGYPLPPVPLPSVVLKGMLLAKGRSEIDPCCRYSMAKLRAWGFVPPIGLATALHAYAEHCCTGDA